MNIFHKNALFCCSFVILLLSSPACGDEKKNILLLHSYHQDLVWTDNVTQGIQSVFKTSGLNYELHIEYMDTKRHTPAVMFPLLEEVYRRKYQQISIDLIIAADNNALDFLLSRRETLFPAIPIVFCGINNFDDALLAGQNNITGVVEAIDVKGTMTLILSLLPNTKQIIVINDTTPTGKANQQKFLEAAQDFAGRVTFRELVNVSTEQLKDSLRNLHDDTVLLVFTFHLDRDGTWYSIQDYLTLIRENTDVPAFSFWDHYLGQGIVGGLMVSGHAQGAHTAEMAIDILHGAPVDTLPILRQSPNVPMFDYQIMQQFGIAEAGLPAKNILINKPSSLYRKYKYVIRSVLLVVVFLTILVIILAMNIVRRKRIEQELRQSEGKFRSITEQMTDMVFITDTQGTILYVSPVAEKIFGYTPDEMQENVFTIFLSEQDVPAALEAFTKCLSTGAPCKNLHLAMKHKDKSFFWGELDGTLYRNNGLVGTIGLIRDISERKRVEEALREREEKFRTLFKDALNPILLVDETGRYIDANQAACDFLECSYEELFTKQVWDFAHPDFLERQKQEHAPFVNRRTLETDYWVHGKIKTLLLNVVPLEIQGQTILYGIGQDITERKRAEEALRESEEKFRALYDNAPLSYQSLDENGYFIDVNPTWLRTLGYEEKDVLGKCFAAFLHPDWKPHFEKNFPEFKRRGYIHDVQFKIRHKDGHYLNISFEGSIGYLPDGSFRQTYCVFQDITERKRAEEILRESEERFRQVYEHMTVGIARVSMDFRIENANEAYCHMLGYCEEELIGKHLRDITQPEIIEENLRKQSQLARGEIDHYRMEKQFVHKSGRVITGILDANLVRNAEGKPCYFLGSVLDITERKRAEEALRESEEKYHALFEYLPIPVFTKNRMGVYTSCNAENLKYWPVNPIGQTDAELLDPGIAAALREADLHVMELGDALTFEEHFTNSPLGERQVLSRKVPLRDGKGQIVGLLGASVDITERKKTEEKIKSALAEREVLLRELYHRTKNNMQVISAMLALKSYTVEYDDVQQIFQEIEHRIQSMALVHHKLYQSQNLSSINLREYIHELAAFLFSSYASSERITLDIDAEDVFVLIDTAIPCGLLLNELISNTLKHAFPGERTGTIRIGLRRIDHNHLELRVADDGIGVPQDFDLRRTKTLGLQNVFALAERQLDGKIQFNADHGLTCHVTFRDDLYEERV